MAIFLNMFSSCTIYFHWIFLITFSSNCFSAGCAIKSNGIYHFLIRCLINVWYQRQNLIQKFQLFVKLSVANLMFFILIIICLKLFHKISQHLYRKYSPINAWKQKENSRYICSNCSPTLLFAGNVLCTHTVPYLYNFFLIH